MRTSTHKHDIKHYVKCYQMHTFLNARLLEALEIVTFDVYSEVYSEQQEQHYLYFLVEGMVQCSHYRANGELAIFAVSTPFAAIGELEIFKQIPVNSTVIATRKTTMLRLSREIIHGYASDDPAFLHFLLDQIRKKLLTSNSFHMSQTLPLNARLAIYLLSSVNTENIVTAPDKEALASLLGTSLRHLNRTLRQFIKETIISDSYPRIRILSRTAVSVYAQNE